MSFISHLFCKGTWIFAVHSGVRARFQPPWKLSVPWKLFTVGQQGGHLLLLLFLNSPFLLWPLDFSTRESSHTVHGHSLHPLANTVAIGQGNSCGCDPYAFVLPCSMFFTLVLSPPAGSSLPIIWSLRILKTVKFRSPQRQNGPHAEAMETGKGKGLAPRCSGHMCNPSDRRRRAPALLCVLWGKLIWFSLASPLLAQRLPFPWPSSLVTFALCYVFRSSLSSANTADMSLFILSIVTGNRYLGYFTIAQ